MMTPSHPPATGGQSSGSSEPGSACRVMETGGPFVLAAPPGACPNKPMAGTVAGRVSLTLAGLFSIRGPIRLMTGTVGTATAAAPFWTTTTLIPPRVDDCARAFDEVTFTLPVIEVPLARPF